MFNLSRCLIRLFQFDNLFTADAGVIKSFLYYCRVFFIMTWSVFPDNKSSDVRRLLIPRLISQSTIDTLFDELLLFMLLFDKICINYELKKLFSFKRILTIHLVLFIYIY